MPKKRNHIPYSKPQTSAHPSISRPRSSHKNDSHDEQDPHKSVNDLLQHLRITQAPAVVPTESRSDVNPKTLHPAISNILQIPETPSPRPRPGMRPFATPGRRRPPGPAPPRSWLETSIHAPADVRKASIHQQNLYSRQRPNPEDIDPLPGTSLPSPHSLQHLTLLHLAKNWDFHIHYDQYYLATLPVRHKQTLLTYIAKYSPNGIDLHGLQTLFLDDSRLDSATGAEGLSHLDLSGSIGRSISLKELKTFLTTTLTPKSPTTASIPESWDTDETPSNPTPTIALPPSPSLTTPTLTHLSLSRPHPSTTTWRALLSLTAATPTLTHLSLAFWPPPSLHPSTPTTAYVSGPVSYTPSTPYSQPAMDPTAASSILRQLSRQTYCLQHLDLTGCTAWIPAALAPREQGGGGGGVEWHRHDGPWSGLQTVQVGQGWVPAALDREGYSWREVLFPTTHCSNVAGTNKERAEESRELERWIRAELEVQHVVERIRGVEKGEAERGGIVVAWGSRRRTGDDDDDGGWGDGNGRQRRQRREGMEKKKRDSKKGCTVHFDRGWEGWWIEDCLCWGKRNLAFGRTKAICMRE
ncbi:MAG: hypothetical protein LQ338_000503 [Usnochroma carphineum]|nr:MAG: hypothetical protein LQ338_000503 [Usnochroma carphineum]